MDDAVWGFEIIHIFIWYGFLIRNTVHNIIYVYFKIVFLKMIECEIEL
jgi:hypothetical protein